MQKQSGISLMEILVTVAIISGGLLVCLLDGLHQTAQVEAYKTSLKKREALINHRELP